MNMCGIAGVAGRQLPEEVVARVERMVHALDHRGPDDRGTSALSSAVLGHARLSIIDLSERGRQPMQDGTGRVHVTFNGEIYNYRELRAFLEKSHRFASDTDTEVLVHGYLEWGLQGLLERIRGMFAFALWDDERGVLHLVRDHLGIKPLIWARDGDRLLFASEAKAIHAYFGSLPPPSATGIVLGIHTLGVPAPWTAHEGYRQLEPGSSLSFSPVSDGLEHCRYWRWKPESQAIESDAAERMVWSTLVESVQRHLVSDVPVGLLLSGGLDSSLVAAACAELGSRPTCFTLRSREDPEGSEVEPAAAVCRRFGFEHRVVVTDTAHARQAEQRLPGVYDEPYGSNAALNSLVLCREVSRSVKVVLGGDGGDELFMGYAWHRRWPELYGPGGERRRWSRRIANRLRTLARRPHWSSDPLAGYAQLVGNLPPGIAAGIFAPSLLARCETDADGVDVYRLRDRPELEWRDRLQALDLELFLPAACLTKLDRASMAFGLEVRVPLLDLELARLSAHLPPDVRCPRGEPKGLLRRIARERLPEELWDRPKRGFGARVERWFDGAALLGELHRGIEEETWWRPWFSPRLVRAVKLLSPPRQWRVLQTWRWLRAIHIPAA